MSRISDPPLGAQLRDSANGIIQPARLRLVSFRPGGRFRRLFRERMKRAAFKWYVGATRLFIGEALAACTADGVKRAICIAHSKRHAMIIPEVELRKVAVQVLL